MKHTLSVGTLAAAQNKKAQGLVAVPGTGFTIPVTIINGAQDGPVVAIISGLHGSEYSCIETTIRLGGELMPDEVIGAVIIVHPANVTGFYRRVEYVVPEDGKNLNRMFPGNPDGTASERLAHFLTQEVIRKATAYIDLHGGDIHEDLQAYTLYAANGDEAVTRRSKGAAECAGQRLVCASAMPGHSMYTAAQNGAAGVLVEMGGRGIWTEDEVEAFCKNIRNVLKYFGALPGEPEKAECVFVENKTNIAARHTGCWYPCVKPGQIVKKGEKIGEIRDLFHKKLSEYVAEKNGDVIFISSALSVKEGGGLVSLADI